MTPLAVRIAIDIDSTLHHHWPLVAAAAKRRFGVDLPYEQQFPWAARRLDDEQLRRCIEDTHSDEAIGGARPYPHAVETVNGWYHAGHWIHITSHRAERSMTATRRWLHHIGLRHDDLYCGDDKVAHCRRIGIELLIDDSPDNLLHALEAGICAATLLHPWTKEVCDASHVISAADWQELARALEPLLAPPEPGRRHTAPLWEGASPFSACRVPYPRTGPDERVPTSPPPPEPAGADAPLDHDGDLQHGQADEPDDDPVARAGDGDEQRCPSHQRRACTRREGT